MNKTYLPYILPTISIIAIFVIALINPSITGSAITPFRKTSNIASEVKITTNKEVVIPANAMVLVTLDNTTKNLTFSQFVKMTRKPYTVNYGKYQEINYEGQGYTGFYTYTLPISKLGLKQNKKLKNHELNVKLIYDEKVFVENIYKYTT